MSNGGRRSPSGIPLDHRDIPWDQWKKNRHQRPQPGLNEIPQPAAFGMGLRWNGQTAVNDTGPVPAPDTFEGVEPMATWERFILVENRRDHQLEYDLHGGGRLILRPGQALELRDTQVLGPMLQAEVAGDVSLTILDDPLEPSTMKDRAVVTVVVGPKADAQYRMTEPGFRHYARRTGADLVVIDSRMVSARRGNLEKFQIFHLLRQYRRVVFLDCDIFIRPDAPDVFRLVPEEQIGAVYDHAQNDHRNRNRKAETDLYRTHLGDIGFDEGYINSGVLVLSSGHRFIFTFPHFSDLYRRAFADQTLLNYMIKRIGYQVFRLPKEFNGMTLMGYSGEKRLRPWFSHFAGLSEKAREMERWAPQFNRTYLAPVTASVGGNGGLRKKPLLFCDTSEIGWSMYIAARMKWLRDRGHIVAVSCDPSKAVLYRGVAHAIEPLPFRYIKDLAHLPSDGNHLYDPATGQKINNRDALLRPFQEAFPEYDLVRQYSRWPHERTFYPYNASPAAIRRVEAVVPKGAKCVLVFPRHRTSKFASRNIPKDVWQRMIAGILEGFPQWYVVSLGASDGAIAFRPEEFGKAAGRFIDLVSYPDEWTLDMMVALARSEAGVAAVGNQSGPLKMTLVCGLPTFMFGHERERHTVEENFLGTAAGFFDLPQTPSGYRVERGGKPLLDAIMAWLGGRR